MLAFCFIKLGSQIVRLSSVDVCQSDYDLMFIARVWYCTIESEIRNQVETPPAGEREAEVRKRREKGDEGQRIMNKDKKSYQHKVPKKELTYTHLWRMLLRSKKKASATST